MDANDLEGTEMNVTREIILDLLPLYLSGEASPATRSLVEEYMKQDPELAQRIRLQWTENIAKVAPSALPPDLELRSLSRTRRLLGLQRCSASGYSSLATNSGLRMGV